MPKPPQKPEDELIMAFLLAGIGSSCSYSLWKDRYNIFSKYNANSKLLAFTITGVSFSSSIYYFIKYLRR